jgi:hypothetical protein
LCALAARLILILWILALALVVISCGPKPAPVIVPEAKPEPRGYPAPTELTARPFHQRVNLAWKTNRSENSVIMGYNIYIANEKNSSPAAPEGTFERVSNEPYPGDTDPDYARESFALEPVENGVRYRVYVTTLYPGNVESRSSDTVEVIPRPEGSFTLYDSFKGNQSGYSFKKLRSVPTDDLDNDIYLATINGNLFVASPKRIEIVLRQSKFFRLGRYASLDVVRLAELKDKPDNVEQAHNGEVFLLQDQDLCFALLRFDSVDIGKKIVKCSFIYQPRPETLKFH